MASINPFKDPEIAANYESWYYNKGKKAVEEEKALLKCFIEGYPDAGTLLEVGCGTGYFTNWFEELGFESVGLDSSSHMIKVAHENHHLFCILGQGLNLPFKARSFDLVTIITTLEFLNRPKEVLQEALRVTRKGLILGVINKHSLLGLRYAKKGGPIWSHARLFSPVELGSMLEEILPINSLITIRTTLWPIFSGFSKLPWGGFVGVNVRLSSEVE